MAKGNKTHAALLLGVPRTTLKHRLAAEIVQQNESGGESSEPPSTQAPTLRDDLQTLRDIVDRLCRRLE